MQDGDISNEVAPRYLCIFEGLIGVLPDKVTERKHRLYVKSHAWGRAARCWRFDSYVEKRFWDMSFRLVRTLDIITFLDEAEADLIKERLDARGWPYGNFWATTEEALLHELLPNPSVLGVIDPDPAHALRYGAKGGISWT